MNAYWVFQDFHILLILVNSEKYLSKHFSSLVHVIPVHLWKNWRFSQDIFYIIERSCAHPYIENFISCCIFRMEGIEKRTSSRLYLFSPNVQCSALVSYRISSFFRASIDGIMKIFHSPITASYAMSASAIRAFQ